MRCTPFPDHITQSRDSPRRAAAYRVPADSADAHAEESGSLSETPLGGVFEPLSMPLSRCFQSPAFDSPAGLVSLSVSWLRKSSGTPGPLALIFLPSLRVSPLNDGPLNEREP